MSTKIKWHGHASFRITTQNGTSIITDPYDPATCGYAPYTEPTDIVIMSSDNDSFHCNTHLVPGPHLTINALELARSGKARNEHGITFTAIEAMEALNHQEHNPDQNGMYRMVVDGLHIGHMGDVGNALNQEQLEFFSGLDVLLALVGGHPTLDLADLKTLIDFAKPKFIIPMHFRTLTYTPRNSFWIETFLNGFDNEHIELAAASEVSLQPRLAKLEANSAPKVLLLDYVHVAYRE